MVARWYTIQVYSGAEDKVLSAIQERAEENNLSDAIEDTLFPKEEVIEVRKGKKYSKSRSFLPGYIFIKMELSDQLWQLIKSLPNVSQLLGDGGRPQPVSQVEIDRIRGQIEEGIKAPRVIMNFEIGETVKITDGPFADFNGNVEEVDSEKSKLKISVSIFGRATPVEIDFAQVEKQ